MPQSLNAQFTVTGKTLHVLAVSLHGQAIPEWLHEEARHAFEALAPFIKNESQVLYLRDIPFINIDGKYPSGYCYNQFEAMISALSWDVDRAQLVATINHELHHMARWQNPGYGRTLGGALLSEGLATYYEEQVSGWSSPWSKAAPAKDAISAAVKDWDDKGYNHSEWFLAGPYGKWTGYGLGYRLAKIIFADSFDLARSIAIKPDEVRELLNGIGS